jgi:potassium uptake Trk family protein
MSLSRGKQEPVKISGLGSHIPEKENENDMNGCVSHPFQKNDSQLDGTTTATELVPATSHQPLDSASMAATTAMNGLDTSTTTVPELSIHIPSPPRQSERNGSEDRVTQNSTSPQSRGEHIEFHPSTVFRVTSPESPSRRHHRFMNLHGVGARPNSSLGRISESSTIRDSSVISHAPRAQEGKHSWDDFFVGRNSQFHGLSEEEREKLGGVEYKALRFLAWIVPTYWISWQLLGALGMGAYMYSVRPDEARANGLDPFWTGSFFAISAFGNSGMALLDANVVALQTSIYSLITMSLLILAGNTCYPVFLRLIVWTIRKMMPDSDRWRDHRNTLRFLLDHPRRCFTHLFPSKHTWWLLMSVICLNGIDWAAFEILNIGNDRIDKLSPGIRTIDGLFQAFAVRSGGFYVVPIPSVRISLQVLYVLMMYIGVYPVTMTIRNSNVYEERSLGIYSSDPGYNFQGSTSSPYRPGRFFGVLKRSFTGEREPSTRSYFVRQQLRAQLAHDLWLLSLAVFLIMIIESSQFERNPAVFSVFNVIFETVSAYGTVGISIGLPDQNYSFCGAFHILSKLILIIVMLRGRHRGLPVAIDRAVLLPSEQLHHAEEEDSRIRLERSATRGSATRGSAA